MRAGTGETPQTPGDPDAASQTPGWAAIFNDLKLPLWVKSEQQENIRLIVREVYRAGFSPAYAIAAVVNAKAESNWIADAFNPEAALGARKGWGSMGLFALLKTTDGRGAARNLGLPPMVNGRPAATDFRRDPTINTRTILQEVARYEGTSVWDRVDWGPSMLEAQESGDVASVVAAFTRHIERPANRGDKGVERAQMAADLFPTLSRIPAVELSWAGGVQRPQALVLETPGKVISRVIRTNKSTGLALLLLIIGALAGAMFLWFRRERTDSRGVDVIRTSST